MEQMAKIIGYRSRNPSLLLKPLEIPLKLHDISQSNGSFTRFLVIF